MKKYEAIYQDLLNMIESHKIKAGELLPSEFHLRDYYKASRDTVRKALMMLSQNGLSYMFVRSLLFSTIFFSEESIKRKV